MLRTVALAASIAALAVPAAASASSAAVDLDGHIVVTAAEGEVNHVRITREDVALPVGVWDTAVTPGASCWNVAAYVQCAGGSPIVVLGDRNDSLTYHDDTTDFLIGPADVDGGAGDDTITTAMSADHVEGGAGNDTIDGYVGDDTLHGGAGDDRVDGSFGDDTLDGGPGVDRLVGGMDDDTLRGGDGADVLRDNEGHDRVVAGAGADDVKTGDGDDAIDLRDGRGGDRVECGLGRDTVDADTGDVAAADCETVRKPRPAAAPQPRPQQPAITGVPSPGATPVPGTAPRSSGPSTSPDRTAPKLRLRVKGRTLTLRADEACVVKIKAGKRTITKRLRPGRATRVRIPGRTRKIKLIATDAAGNTTKRTTQITTGRRT